MSTRRILLTALAVGAVLLACAGSRPASAQPTAGGVYYVSPAGSDSNPGTITQPWRTIQHAADTLAAGDMVYIWAGTYRERVVPQNSGSAGQYITYAAYPGEMATIDGSSVTLPDDLAGLFEVSNRSYIKISGLRVINAGPHDNNAGILVNDSSYVVVENNYTYNTVSSGIGVWGGDHVTIDGNTVEHACTDIWQECLTVASTDVFEIKNNEVFDCQEEGIDVKDNASNGQVYNNHVHDVQAIGIYVDAWDRHTHDIAVFQNRIHHVSTYNGIALASEMGGLLEDIAIYNNLVYQNHYVGLDVSVNDSGSPDGRHPMRNLYIINNTFYDNGRDAWGGGILVDNPDAENVVIRNNICSQNFYFQILVNPVVPTQTLTVDHNLIDGYQGTEGEIYGDVPVTGDPRFVNPSGGDFHLRTDSPAIDAGSAIDAPAEDFDGRPRPYDGDGDGADEYDIGAYEVGAPLAPAAYLPLVARALSASSMGVPPLEDGASQVTHADPGTLFVKPGGSGTLCAQAQPCNLQTALAQVTHGDTIYVAGGTYTGSGGAVVTVTKSVTLYGGWDGATTAPPVRDPAACPTTLDGENQRRGVYVGSGAALTLDGFTVTRGRSGYSGGGIAADLASLTVRNCQITGNAAPGDGGGIFVNGGSAQILNNRVISNTGTWAGGLRIINDADATIIGNEIRHNVAQVAGGGIEVDCCGGSAPLIARNLIADNHGGYRGGGVRVNETHAQLVNNIVVRNQATIGAGVWLEGQASYPADAALVHNTLVGDLSGGEGVWVGAHVTVTLVNNILAGHTTGITVTALMSSSISADHNLLWNTSDPVVGTNAVLADPLLDATYHLTSGSPARDAGAVVNEVTVDFDGDPRPVGGYDIGADEIALRCYLPLLLRGYNM